MSRSRIILLLLVILGVAVAYAWMATPKQRRVVPGQNPLHQVEPRQLDVAMSAFPAIVDLDFSGGGDHPYQIPQKNLFGPLYLPPKLSKPRPAPAPKRTRPAVVRPQKVNPVVQPSGPKPIQSLEVLGYLNKAGVTTVFLSSKQGEVYLVKTGDRFAADLVVRSVSSRDITIARRQTDQQIVLQLGETKSQRLPKIKYQSDRPDFKLPPEENPDQPTPGTEPGVVSEKAEK